ncbi:NAD-dependent epimerase/dehydratase family protein [Aquabacterium sp. A7-Y]|uniref:NAD-dependent epimerase/dehydratase family protein n=1 Tax=Aquabacterium sp. A7-Y TaxID=1349605 RepID=UPI00223D6750|nr:NAD-dependent epimerase/dehydratase family protein [Aquabacterium sp. A7-Y]MCW7536786.1 NAD-dependent epimerase/dehydratase family protein [Aquabacterium sp. A7-Y]
MKVMVTGGAGFVGSHIVDKFRDQGIDVCVYDLCEPTQRKDVDFVQGSVLDLEALTKAAAGVDYIIHTAAVADVKDVLADPMKADAVNVRGTVHVLEAARRSNRVKRVVYSSTTWVYSDAEPREVTEDTALGAPSHFYTATKIAGEHYCKSYSKLYGLDVTILRYGIPYGPRARPGAVVPIFVDKAMRKEPITLEGDGLQFRKFVYVEDLAEGHVAALKPVAANKIYNLDGVEKISIKQIAESVCGHFGDVVIEYKPARPGDFSGKDVSSVRAREELGWSASTPFEVGLGRYIDWYKSRHKNPQHQ